MILVIWVMFEIIYLMVQFVVNIYFYQFWNLIKILDIICCIFQDYFGYEVNFVMNYIDVDDKIIIKGIFDCYFCV